MTLRLDALSLLVPDYDAGIRFCCGVLGFDLVENTDLGGGKRWVRVAPKGGGAALILAQAVGTQRETIGRQAGGRVFLFLHADDFSGEHARLTAYGVRFAEAPRREPYGMVAVFEDPFGNRWDLIGRA